MDPSQLYSAAAIARNRLETYLDEKLSGEWDQCAWEFYRFLLEQAQNHAIDTSGFVSEAYKQDHSAAIANIQRKRSHAAAEAPPFNNELKQPRKSSRIA